MREIVSEHRRLGCWWLAVMLRCEGKGMTLKRCRLYREERLTVRKGANTSANQRWSLDFVRTRVPAGGDPACSTAAITDAIDSRAISVPRLTSGTAQPYRPIKAASSSGVPFGKACFRWSRNADTRALSSRRVG